MSLLPLLALVCSSVSFDAPRVYEHPSPFSRDAVIADFDGDGHNDLGYGATTGPFLIRYGEPGGTLSAPHTIPTPVYAAGDAIGDALPDLFTTGGILENLGGREFGAPVGVPRNGRFFTHDFTGDGRNDLVIGSTPNQLLMLERMPNGRLESLPGSDTGAYTPWSAAGDVDGDRRMEVIGVNDTSVRVFRYAGSGRFEVAATHTTSGKPMLVETADLDRDGRDDIVVYLQAEGAQLDIFYGDGRIAKMLVGPYAQLGNRMLVADFNNDGAIDVLVGDRGGYNDTVTIHFNDGTGTLRQKTQFNLDSIYELSAGDLTGDGRTDLVLPVALGIAVIPGVGNGRFFAPSLHALPQSWDHAAGDFDHDGVDEVLFFRNARLSVAWGARIEQLDHHYVSAAIRVNVAPNDEIVTQYGTTVVTFARRDGAWHKRTIELEEVGIARAADFDGDAKNELVSIGTAAAGYTMRVRAGDDGRVLYSTFLPSPAMHDHFDFALDDFTGDGVPDLAFALSGTPQYPQVGGIPLRNGSITIFAGSTSGGLTRVATPVTDQSPRDLVTGDFNGDGKRDLAFTTYDDDARVIYGQAGNFTAMQTVIPAAGGTWLAASDVNGDGITDLLGVKFDSFLLTLGTREGLVESGRWSHGFIGGRPVLARLTPHAAPTLLLSAGNGPYRIDSTCLQSRRRSVRH